MGRTQQRVSVVAQQSGADSASVIFDALQAATARGADVLIADTAGRLHTKSNLMEELSKVARVMKKIDPDAPHEVMLVVDATTGQNALNQAVHFHQAVGLTGITLTKLDGTAKGGILFAIADQSEGARSVSSASARRSMICAPSTPTNFSMHC
jgi:fused signal recognition particle receptor